MSFPYHQVLNQMKKILAWSICISPLVVLFKPVGVLTSFKLIPLEAFLLFVGLLAGIYFFLSQKYKSMLFFITPFLFLPFSQLLSGLINSIQFKEILSPIIKDAIYFILYPGLIVSFLSTTSWFKRFFSTLIVLFLLGSIHSYLNLVGIHLNMFTIVTGTVQAGMLLLILPLTIFFSPKKLWISITLLVLSFLFHLFNPHPTFFICFLLILVLGFFWLPTFSQRILLAVLVLFFISSDFIGFKHWDFSGIHYWSTIGHCIILNATSTFDAVLNTFIIGVGATNTPEVTSRYYTFDPALLPFSESVRSLYGNIFIELGILGLFSLIGGFLYFQIGIKKQTHRIIQQTLLWSFLVSAIVIDYSLRHNIFLISITIGLLLVLSKTLQVNSDE